MRTPILTCTHCGSSNVRRSKRQSMAELMQMTLGVYPFRCMDCTNRFWASVWLVSKLTSAKCPRCLSSELMIWPEKHFPMNFQRRVMILLGAHRYRCQPCRHNFVSFRPRLVEESSAKSTDTVSNSERPAAAKEIPALD